MKTVITRTPLETLELGNEIGRHIREGSVIALSGPLGSGKTTLVKGIAAGMNILDTVTSPSFTLVNQYPGKLPLTHIDVFRLDDIEEFEMIGGEDMLYDDTVTIIEWSEKIASMLPEGSIFITITIGADGSRTFTIDGLVL